jgi:4'-phosphopantetheinyl transferase
MTWSVTAGCAGSANRLRSLSLGSSMPLPCRDARAGDSRPHDCAADPSGWDTVAWVNATEVAVYLARPERLAEPTARTRAHAVLDGPDRAHVARFVFERDREVALASRALQRLALAAETGVDAAAWRFAAGPSGRPEITAPRTQIQFNVANTAGLVGCAIALDRELGLDLEAHRADAPPELVARCFTPAERAGLAARPAADQPRRFVELWVCKEAYLKARGVGLGLPLEHIDVVLDDGDPHLRLDPALGDDAATWQLALWSPTPAHAAALCVRRPAGAPPVTTRHHWDP